MDSYGFGNNSETQFQKIISEKNRNVYSRFIPEKFANSGQDPKGKIIEFADKDLIKPIKKPIVFKEEYDKKILNSTSWAINTTKICTNEINLPKIQNYRNYNFIKKNEENSERYKRSYLSTDNISLKIPEEKVKNENDENNNKSSYSLIDLKSIKNIIISI
jgi:hypothetical protein